MSLNAYVWAGQLPLDLVGASAFRVLLKMADVADENGKGVWMSAGTIAKDLGCSTRTVQRAIFELKIMGVIEEGDQRQARHIRADRRPIVYDLNLGREIKPKIDIHDTTNMSPDDTTNMSRYDKKDTHDTTAVVVQTVIKPNKSSLSVNHRSNVSNVTRHPKFIHVDEVLADCSNESGHAFSRGVCSHCNKAREVLREEATA